MNHPFQFGLNNTGAGTLKEWQEYARKAEDLGFTHLIMQEHVGPQFAPLPALLAAAAATSRIRLTTLVLDNDFRHPGLLAKEATTIDLLTEGRFELGLGAGWLQADYDKLGLTFDPPRQRLERLKEAVWIIKAFFRADKAVSFEGSYYRVRDLDASPRPVQQPGPPLLIGGRQKRMLSFAAREADVVSISMLDSRVPGAPPPPTFAEKVGWVRAASGERFGELIVHANSSGVQVTDDQKGAVAAAADRLKVKPEDVLETPANLIGSVEAIVDQLQAWRETSSLSYIVVPGAKMVEVAPIVARLAGS